MLRQSKEVVFIHSYKIVKEIVCGSLLGVLLSGIMIKTGQGIQLEWSFLMIVILSLVMSRIHPKLTCLAYVLAVVYGLDGVLIFFGIKENYFKIDYVSMIQVVGILHIIEGLLTRFCGGKQNRAIITYRGEEIVGGYQSFEKWLIPLFFFKMKEMYIPIVAGVVYCNDCFTMSPREKAKKMGRVIEVYGLSILVFQKLVIQGILPKWIALFSMPILHEIIFFIDGFIEEKGEILYGQPKQGIRIMQILKPSPLDIEPGDILLKINGAFIENEDTYRQLLESKQRLWVEVEKNNQAHEKFICNSETLKESELVFLPPF